MSTDPLYEVVEYEDSITVVEDSLPGQKGDQGDKGDPGTNGQDGADGAPGQGYISGLHASRPAAGTRGRVYIATDVTLDPKFRRSYDDGTRWHYEYETKTVLSYGADPTGLTDSWQAFKDAMRDVSLAANGPDAANQSGIVRVPPGTYYLSKTLHIDRWVSLIGESTGTFGTGVRLQFAPGVGGLVIDFPFTSEDGGRGDGSTVANMEIHGTKAAFWTPNTVVATGARRRASTDIKLGLVCLQGGTTGGTEPAWTSPANGVGHYVSGIGAKSDETATVNDGGAVWGFEPNHGVTLWGRCTIRDCRIGWFNGDGVHIMTDVTGNPITGANGWQLYMLRIEFVNGDGVYTHGGDSNAGYAQALDVDCTNGIAGWTTDPVWMSGWGIRDDAFLANTWVACQVAFSTLGSYHVQGLNAPSVFIGCYAEDGQNLTAYSPAIFIGGLLAGTLTSDSSAQFINGGGMRGTTFVSPKTGFTGITGSGYTRFYAGQLSGNGAAFGWQFDGSAPNNANNDGDGYPWWLTANSDRSFTLTYANGSFAALYLVPLNWTSPRGHVVSGMMGMINHMAGVGAGIRLISYDHLFDVAGQVHKYGDRSERIVNGSGQETSTGGYLGYICTLGGTVGSGEVHRPYAPIEGQSTTTVTGDVGYSENEWHFVCRTMVLAGSPGAGFTVTLPQQEYLGNALWYWREIVNNTGQTASLKVAGSAQVLTLAAGKSACFRCDGTDLWFMTPPINPLTGA